MIKNWKKNTVAVLTVLTLTVSTAAPAMAYGRNCDGICDYHNQNCDGNCEYRSQTFNRTGNAGKKAASNGYYCTYHDKTHKKKSTCSNYCKKHKTIHANGKRHSVAKRTAAAHHWSAHH